MQSWGLVDWQGVGKDEQLFYFFMIWPQFGGRTRWRSSFDSWARALAKLDVTNEFLSFALARRIIITCAKFHCDRWKMLWTRALQSFIEFQIRLKYHYLDGWGSQIRHLFRYCGRGGTTEIQVSAVPENRKVPLLLADPRDLLPHPERGYQIPIPTPTDKTCILKWAVGRAFGWMDSRTDRSRPCRGELGELPQSRLPVTIGDEDKGSVKPRPAEFRSGTQSSLDLYIIRCCVTDRNVIWYLYEQINYHTMNNQYHDLFYKF